jgi:hypothetical protein
MTFTSELFHVVPSSFLLCWKYIYGTALSISDGQNNQDILVLQYTKFSSLLSLNWEMNAQR